MSVTLVMVLLQVLGGEPQVARVAAPDLKTCFDYAQQFLDSETAKQAASASAGCVIGGGQPS